ncbi:D-alanyl-D-alanine carboxypeptidase/D-alanyl-D-alanine endopeptidase [Bounagaea algeriensis]
MAEPQVPGGDGSDGGVADTGEPARGEASEQAGEASDVSGGPRSGRGGANSEGADEAGAGSAGSAEGAASAGSSSAAATGDDESVVWPTEEEEAVHAVEPGPDANDQAAGTDCLAAAGETDAGAADAGAADTGAADEDETNATPPSEQTQRIPAVPPEAASSGVFPSGTASSGAAAADPAATDPAATDPSGFGSRSAGSESDAERTANIPIVPGGQQDSATTRPHAVQPPAPQQQAPQQQAPQQPFQQQAHQPQQPAGDAQPTQYIPRVEPDAEPPATARPEDFGFGAPASSASSTAQNNPAAQDGPTAQNNPAAQHAQGGPTAQDGPAAQNSPAAQNNPAAQHAQGGPTAQGSQAEPAARPPAGAVADPGGEAAEPATAEPATAGSAAPASAPDEPAANKSRRPALLVGAAGLVAVLVLSAAFLPGLFGSGPAAPPRPPVQLNPVVNPVDGAEAPKPTRQGIESQLAEQLRNPALGNFSGTVVDARSGETLWAQEPGRGMVPGSTTKVLTASAALLTLDPDQRFSTKVVQGSEPGSVVLVGGGDPTLSKLPAGRESVYGDVAHLDDLTEQVEQATGGDVESVRFDTSRYADDPMGPAWDPADVAGGYVAPIQPMMLDGARADPTADTSERAQRPGRQVAQGLASRLGLHEQQVSAGQAPENARVLGEVRSPTVRELVENMLQHSDNVLAEVMAREVAIATGHQPSFEGATQAVRSVLTRHGVDLGGTALADGSGMSTQSRITPRALGEVLHLLARPGQNGSVPADAAKLRQLLPGLPVAGGSGSLDERYQGSEGRGWVRAKTGTLDGVNSLAGTVLTEDGRVLVFALMSNGPSSAEARPALDAVAAGLRDCGCR